LIYFVGNTTITNSAYAHASVDDVFSYFSGKEAIAVDTETTGLDPHTDKLLLLQLGDSDNQFVIDTGAVPAKTFSGLLASKLAIVHNSKFDYKFLKLNGVELNRIFDTKLAEMVIYAGFDSHPAGLRDVVERYIKVTLDKSEREGFTKLVPGQGFTEDQIVYAARDVRYLHEIMAYQQALISKYDLGYCVSIENEVVKSLGDIEINGVLLVPEKWRANALKHKERLTEVEGELDSVVRAEPKLAEFKKSYVQADLFGEAERDITLNYASPLQIKKVCKALGIAVESTNKESLDKLVGEHAFFPALQKHREVSKIVSTYGDSFLENINPTTKRVHTDFWQIVSTGRLSSSKPNMQNIPRSNSFRNCFEARPGYMWVSADYVSQELCLMADRSGEKVFIEALNNKEDLHCICATLLFGRTITKEDKAERTAAKTIVFGLCYGMGAQKLATSLRISIKEAEELMDRFAKAFPTVTAWLEDSGLSAKRGMKSVTQDICRRVRWFPNMREAQELRKAEDPNWRRIYIIEGGTEREGKNHLIQGSAANITKEALIEVRNLIKSSYPNSYLIGQVHDSIECEVQSTNSEEFAKDMEIVMVRAASKYLTHVRMGVDITVTTCWTK
jgi:DNA polymerase-1